jgi:predicted RNase H-like HicB family nuclease
MAYKVGVVIEKDEYGYYAYCPELEGCQSLGDTFE